MGRRANGTLRCHRVAQYGPYRAWAASLGLFAGAGRLLRAGGLLILYGPFMHDGVHNATSNAAFDVSLKASNPSWGLRDITDLERIAESSGLGLRAIAHERTVENEKPARAKQAASAREQS